MIKFTLIPFMLSINDELAKPSAMKPPLLFKLGTRNFGSNSYSF